MRWQFGAACVALFATWVAVAQSNLEQQAHAALQAGKFTLADRTFESCIDASNQSQDAATAARCMLGQAQSKIMLADLLASQELLEQAKLLSEQNALDDVLLNALITEGRLLGYQARFNQANEALERALIVAEQDPEALARAYFVMAQVAFEQFDRGNARIALAQGWEQVQQISDDRTKARLALGAGETILFAIRTNGTQASEINLATEILDNALSAAKRIEAKRLESLALGLLGEFYLLAGQPDDALKLARTAAFYAQQEQAPELAYRWEWLVGRSLRARGEYATAAEAMMRATTALSGVRSGLLQGIRGRRTGIRELLGPVFQDHADVLLTQARRTSDFDQSQRLLKTARNVIEAFKSAELQDYFLDECVVDIQDNDAALDNLAADTAVLYPIPLADRTEILVSVNGVLHQYQVDASGEDIARQARQFRRALEQRSSHRYKINASRLYDWLVAPTVPLLETNNIKTIVFVPDGALRNIPLAAFYDGERFLIERFAIATTPGLNLTDPQPIAAENRQFLVNGLTDAVQGYPALPSVEVELTALTDLYSGEEITLLKNQEYSTTNLSDAISGNAYDIVHFASHGEFQADVSQSFLLTYDEKLTMDQLEEYMQLRRFSERPVELLTLSACQTAAGDDKAALGLAGIAIKAGARSALGTLWYINDKAASELITDFYGNLKQSSNTKADALRLAQLELVADRRYNHPGYWAPFLLIGNWL